MSKKRYIDSTNMMNITVIGMGYVGMSLAVLLSRRHRVTAVDILPDKIEKIKRWESPLKDRAVFPGSRKRQKNADAERFHGYRSRL